MKCLQMHILCEQSRRDREEIKKTACTLREEFACGANLQFGSLTQSVCLLSFLHLLLLPHAHCLTYFLTPWSRDLEKLTGFQLVKKLPGFHGTRRFITAFTSARHLSLSRVSSIQSIPPHLTSWRSILILSSHLRLGLPNCLLPSGFPTKNLYTPRLSHIRSTYPAYLISTLPHPPATELLISSLYLTLSCTI